jgi:hypothetical protein
MRLGEAGVVNGAMVSNRVAGVGALRVCDDDRQ